MGRDRGVGDHPMPGGASISRLIEEASMESLRVSSLYLALLAASVLCDVVATAYLKWAGDRFQDTFLIANLASIVLFAPAIVTFGYALREGPSYLVTTLAWLVGLTLSNTLVGILVFGDPFGMSKVAGMGAALIALVLLTV
jgi:multidrug transporter EmrE-like cation transporter